MALTAPVITPLTTSDRSEWEPLWQGYLTFYETEVADEITEATFARLVAGEVMQGAIARDEDGRAVGLVNWLWHAGTWNVSDHVYLEDLFVAPDVRGGGVGRALIEYVVADARARGADSVYWHTQTSNATARRLYDSLATDTGYIHYEIELG
jgi:GNAT superfamily N-acetyltransferase